MPNEPVVVFDVGVVLLDWDPRHLYRKIFADEARMEWFLATICTGAWNVEQDRGRSWAEAVAERLAAHPEWETEIRAFDERWGEMLAGAIEPSVKVLEKLKEQNRPVYAITNFSAEKWPLALDRFDFLSWFDGAIVSGAERLLKPQPEIYETLLSRYGLSAPDCLFIDDSEKNVRGAEAVGMQALHFTPGIDLAAELKTRGVHL